MQQVPDAVAKGLIDGPTDQMERMTGQAGRLGPATLSRCADIVHNGLVEMRGTTAPRLLLELITARMLLPGAEDSTGALLQRLERMERRLTLGDTAGSAPTRSTPSTGTVSACSRGPPGSRARTAGCSVAGRYSRPGGPTTPSSVGPPRGAPPSGAPPSGAVRRR